MDVAVDTQWILQRHSVTTESRPPASWTRDVCLVFPRRMPWSTLETRGDGAPSSIRQFPRLDTLIVIVRHVLESRCNEQDTKQSTVTTQTDLHRAHLAYNSQIIQVCWASPTDNCTVKLSPNFAILYLPFLIQFFDRFVIRFRGQKNFTYYEDVGAKYPEARKQ